METLERSGAASARTRTGARRWLHRLRGHPQRNALLALLLVSLAALVMQGFALQVPRKVTWDEAVYLSQVLRGEPASPFLPHHARGVTLVVAPVAVFGASLEVVRLWLAVLSSVGLFVAFRPWLRTIGMAAPLAALLFAGNWVVRAFAAEIYPNYWAALGCIAAAGHLASYLRAVERRQLYGVAAWIAFAALMRPSDAVFVAAGLFVITLLLRPRLMVAVTVALAIGGLVGVTPRFAESYVRFGWNPVQSVVDARPREGAERIVANNLMVYANNLTGPVRCAGPCRTQYNDNPRWELSGRSIAMMAAIAALMALAMARPRRARIPVEVYVAAAGMVPHLYYYLTCNCAANLRYLLPAYGLVTVCVGAGLVGAMRMVRGSPVAVAAYTLVPAVLLAWLGWQTTLTRTYLDRSGILGRDRPAAVADMLDERAAGRPCMVATEWQPPQIQYWSDCLTLRLNKGARLQPPLSSPRSEYDLRTLADDGYQIYVLSETPRLSPRSPVTRNNWTREKLTLPRPLPATYWLFTPESPEDVPPAPRG